MGRYTPVVLLIILALAGAWTGTSLEVEYAINGENAGAPLELVEITRFSITPAVTATNQQVVFMAEITNSGNVESDIVPELIVYSSGAPVKRLFIQPLKLPPGGNVTISGDFTAPPALGEYRTVFMVHYRNQTESASAERMLQVTSERARIAAVKNETSHMSFPLFPVLVEGRPGEATAVSLTLRNPSSEPLGTATLRLEGIPAEWVTLSSEELSLGANQSGGINIGISVPESALPGEHLVRLTVRSSREMAVAGFVFRIKPYTPELTHPAVLRKVYVNEDRKEVYVELLLENTGTYADVLRLVEEVPKEVATSAGEITFNPPAVILRDDPLVAWRLDEVDPYERFSLSYTVPEAGPDRYAYVYWPGLRISVLQMPAWGIRSLQFSSAAAAYTFPGREAVVRLLITNPTFEALNISVDLSTPPDWEVVPSRDFLFLLPGAAQEVTFKVRPPADASPGSYTLTAIVSGRGGEVSQPITVVLQEVEKETSIKKPLLFLGTALAVVLLVYALTLIYRRRKAYRREVVEAVGRIRSSMEEE